MTWCNLGFLWYVANDIELAQQAFEKAKIIEPESALSWLGQGMIAHMENKDSEAQASFAQAVMLSGGSLVSFPHALNSILTGVDPVFS